MLKNECVESFGSGIIILLLQTKSNIWNKSRKTSKSFLQIQNWFLEIAYEVFFFTATFSQFNWIFGSRKSPQVNVCVTCVTFFLGWVFCLGHYHPSAIHCTYNVPFPVNAYEYWHFPMLLFWIASQIAQKHDHCFYVIACHSNIEKSGDENNYKPYAI